MTSKCFIQVFIGICAIQIEEPSWLLIMPDKRVESELLIVLFHYPKRIRTPSDIKETLSSIFNLQERQEKRLLK